MSYEPYTDEQVRQFKDACYGQTGVVPREVAGDALKMLRDAGIKVVFPEPRYYARPRPDDSGTRVFEVLDRERCERWSEGLIIASFRADADGKTQAQEHADRLNREGRR